jgi:hypothetical protein
MTYLKTMTVNPWVLNPVHLLDWRRSEHNKVFWNYVEFMWATYTPHPITIRHPPFTIIRSSWSNTSMPCKKIQIVSSGFSDDVHMEIRDVVDVL